LFFWQSVMHWPPQSAEQLKVPGLVVQVVSQAFVQVVTGVAVQPPEQESASWTLQSMPPLHAAVQSAPTSTVQPPDRVVMSALAEGASMKAAANAVAANSRWNERNM
jgi:hypothetical protein